ncbi:hypothetical protein DFH07DRAFT_774018 [Mycena maculata]|uniref:F-box domain-containing protein n=1 Tax=Mycena maculata TaxID=230809 RepID=A0AAD7IZ43_9AGAR|nr:hypothetical protein DFH07DRAFT_774018 [Mycena maculata]
MYVGPGRRQITCGYIQGNYIAPEFLANIYAPISVVSRGLRMRTPSCHTFTSSLAPKLRRSTLHLRSQAPASLLPNLVLRYATLRKLSIIVEDVPHSSLVCPISEIVMQLEQIEDLSVPKLDRASFDQLPSLRKLCLGSGDVQDLYSARLSPSDTPHHHPFPALRTIDFAPSVQFEFIIEFLGLFSDCRMSDFYHFGVSIVTKSTMGSMYRALAGHLSHTTLKNLHVKLVAAPPVATLSELATLFCFRNLVDLSLSPAFGFNIDDSTAWDMARAWPNLQSLNLEASTLFCHPSRMTLHGLRGFAQHCRGLKRLSVTFNASTVL